MITTTNVTITWKQPTPKSATRNVTITRQQPTSISAATNVTTTQQQMLQFHSNLNISYFCYRKELSLWNKIKYLNLNIFRPR